MKRMVVWMIIIGIVGLFGIVSAQQKLDIPEPPRFNESEICMIKTQTGDYTGKLIPLDLDYGWNMVGFPGRIEETTRVDGYCNDISGLCPDFGHYYYFMYIHHGGGGFYTMDSEAPQFNTGYWMYITPSQRIENRTWYCCIDSDDTFMILLYPGWNLITNPCCHNISVTEVFGEGTVENDKGYWYDPHLHTFVTNGVLEPGKSYFVKYNGIGIYQVSWDCKPRNIVFENEETVSLSAAMDRKAYTDSVVGYCLRSVGIETKDAFKVTPTSKQIAQIKQCIQTRDPELAILLSEEESEPTMKASSSGSGGRSDCKCNEVNAASDFCCCHGKKGRCQIIISGGRYQGERCETTNERCSFWDKLRAWLNGQLLK